MKKFLYVILFSLLLLIGCSNDSAKDKEKTEVNETTTTETKPENNQSAETVEEDPELKLIDAAIADYGEPVEVYFNNDVRLEKKFSAVNVTITNIQMFDLKVDESYESQMKYKENPAHLISIKFEAKNIVKRDIDFNAVMDTRLVIGDEQAESAFFDSPSTIAPGATVNYEIYFEVKQDIRDVNQFTLYFEPANDAETYEQIGKKEKWNIKLNK